MERNGLVWLMIEGQAYHGFDWKGQETGGNIDLLILSLLIARVVDKRLRSTVPYTRTYLANFNELSKIRQKAILIHHGLIVELLEQIFRRNY